MSNPMDCECCWELFRKKVPAPHWMEWGEWLCSEHAAQAIDEGCAIAIPAATERKPTP